MAGANSKRTSWSPEEVSGQLFPNWFKPFEAYISQKVQLIAADDKIFVATASGLYAINAETGAEEWLYATSRPLGHSPTIQNGIAYVGGLDAYVHAIDISSGAGVWTFAASGGFQTSPAIDDNTIYLGDRSGMFYAIAIDGEEAGTSRWQFQAAGPILYSAALSDSQVFFAAEDGAAYALDKATGALNWKTEQLPGAGFQSWWPVIYEDYVIFSGSNNYRTRIAPGSIRSHLHDWELDELYLNHEAAPKGKLIGQLGQRPGKWATNTPTIDATPTLDYLTAKPWRRSVFVLDQETGEEAGIAPIAWSWTHNGTRYPPVIGGDGALYTQNSYLSDPAIAGGHVSGWEPNSPYISLISADWNAVDEPMGVSAGGNTVYWNLCCDREAGSMDISQPEQLFPNRYRNGILPSTGDTDPAREWRYFNYSLATSVPGYDEYFHNGQAHLAYGGPNGTYGNHGDVNAPIPYKGRVYMHRGNSVIAYSPDTAPVAAASASKIHSQETQAPTPKTPDTLRQMLSAEVAALLNAGHMRPGYTSHGVLDLWQSNILGDDFSDYFHQPADTMWTLLLAIPHLDNSLRDRARDYLQSEYRDYRPHLVNHIGWDGAAREAFALPPEVVEELANNGQKEKNWVFMEQGGPNGKGVWGTNPFAFYVLWKYAQEFDIATNLWTTVNGSLERPPKRSVLEKMPYAHNAFIAGYMGYLELQKLAGKTPSRLVQLRLRRLISLRLRNFNFDAGFANDPVQAYGNSFNVETQFMYLVPELAQLMRKRIPEQVDATLRKAKALAPMWFVSGAQEAVLENSIAPLGQAQALFTATAWLTETSAEELSTYVDAPFFARGDLYYIQKLALALDAYQRNPIEGSE